MGNRYIARYEMTVIPPMLALKNWVKEEYVAILMTTNSNDSPR